MNNAAGTEIETVCIRVVVVVVIVVQTDGYLEELWIRNFDKISFFVVWSIHMSIWLDGLLIKWHFKWFVRFDNGLVGFFFRIAFHHSRALRETHQVII